jgi:glutamate synthase domain-containing protein 3
MAQLGIARFEDLVGRVDLLEMDEAIAHWRARGVDLAAVLHTPAVDGPLRRTEGHAPVLFDALDWQLIEAAEHGGGTFTIENRNRTVGGLLSNWVTRRFGRGGSPSPLRYELHGSAGQSFGAWLAPGIELTLYGDANDYVGKGLSGGVLAVRPPEDALFEAERNVIAGNTILYGATAGTAFFRGLVGERFAVRNSGATAVVEGVGDHGCEYMTGGVVVVLGPTGRNFAAGMSGGIAYVLELDETKCNRELVALEALDDDDLELVRALVDEHRARTGSTVAVDFDAFVKVMPHDYKAALQTASAGGHGLFITETEGVAA